MAAQLEEVIAVHPDAETVWSQHVLGAVKKFIKTAVVIDNQPYVKSSTTENAPLVVQTNSGLGDDVGALVVPAATVSEAAGAHDLDIRKISDVFAESGVACAFVLPDDDDADVDRIKNRVLCAAKASDIVVIDWYLRKKDSSLTLQILRSIADSDRQENGRMRLLCVYTGEPLDSVIFNDIKQHLADGDLVVSDVQGAQFCAKNNNCLVVLLNKAEVSADILPGELIRFFACLADGLVSSFALAAIGAIRKNTHHMLTRFGSSLDSAYISNRLITNPPGDVAELMRELLVAECDNALGLDSIADDYLEQDSITKWMNLKEASFSPKTYDAKVDGEKQKISTDRIFLDGLLQYGIGDKTYTVDGVKRIDFPEFHRAKISATLAGSSIDAHRAENEFARLVAFRREAFGSSTSLLNPSWKPSLTTGTVLRFRDGENFRYLMCFTPACDALRIQEPRPFVFLEGRESSKPYNLVVKDEDGCSIGLQFDKKYPVVLTFLFSPDQETQRVRGERKGLKDDASCFVFNSTGADVKEFTWLGETRYSRAASEMASLANVWMRIGIIDSEYLRLAGRDHIKFEN